MIRKILHKILSILNLRYYCGTCGKEISKIEKEAINRCVDCMIKRDESSSSTK